MTKAQAKRRLAECRQKMTAVFVWSATQPTQYVKVADVEAVEKVVARCLKRLG